VTPSLDGRTFVGVSNTASGEVSGETVFHYREQGGTVWADYGGGSVVEWESREGSGRSVVEERRERG
jgi:hypothetical protein